MQFDELLQNYEKALSARKLGYSSRLGSLACAGGIIRLHESERLHVLDETVIARYAQEIDKRFYDGKMGKGRYRLLLTYIKRFLDFCDTGEISTTYSHAGSRYTLTPEYERIANDFLASDTFHPNTKNDMRWVSHKYFAWLKKEGCEDLSYVSVKELQSFLLVCSKNHPPSSMHNIKLYLKKLYTYLYESELSKSDYAELLSFRVNREVKVFPALPMCDVARLLDSIDRNTKIGKRTYAIMCLGSELGLRACDVVNLKLSDIDWVNGEIKVLQSKTRKTVILPLTEKLGIALRDYVLNARPKTEHKHLFMRAKMPHTPLKSAVTIGEIYRDCCKTAGLPIRKSFHTLRRSLATSMITNGSNVTTVAQVLGDEKIASIQKYISLDSKHLKRCALSFEGIVPTVNGGDMR